MSFFSIGRSVPAPPNPTDDGDAPAQPAPTNGAARANARISAPRRNALARENDAGQQDAPAAEAARPGLLAGLRKRSTGLGHAVTDAIGGAVDRAGQKAPRGPTLPNHPIDARFASTIRTGSKGRPLVPSTVKAPGTPKPLHALPRIPEETTSDELASMRLPSASPKSDKLMQQALGRFSTAPPSYGSSDDGGGHASHVIDAAIRTESVSTTGSIASLAALRVSMQQKFSASAPRADGGGTRELEAEILEASRRSTPLQSVAYSRAGMLCDALSVASGADANRARQILQRLNAGLSLNDADDEPATGSADTVAAGALAGGAAARALRGGAAQDAQRAAAQQLNRVAQGAAPRAPQAAHLEFEMPIELMQFGEGIADRLDALPASPITPSPVSSPIDAMAWRAAQLLARTNNGYACLETIAGASWPNQAQDPGLSDAVVSAPRQWLLAANALVDATGCDAHPASIAAVAARHAAAAPNGQGTTAKHASAIAQAAEAVWSSGTANRLSGTQKGALFAARQGFYTDGPGTPFAATKSRLAKFVNHSIPRASASPVDNAARDNAIGAANDALDAGNAVPDDAIDADADRVPVSKTRSRWAAAVRPFGKQKTAVASMRKGIQGANLGVLSKDRQTLDTANTAALTALHAALSSHPTPRPLATSRVGKWMMSSRALRAVVSDAELAVLAEASPPYGARIDDTMLDAIAARTATAIAALPLPADHASFREKRAHRATLALHRELTADASVPGARDKMRALIRKRLTNGNDVVDFAKLNAWQQRIAGSDVPDAPGAPDDALQRHMHTIERIGAGAATRLRNAARHPESDDYRQMGDEIIDHLESGGKAIFTEGGKIGLSTRGLTATVAAFPLVSPRLNLAASEGREASFEISRSTASYKIGIGTRERLRVDAGAGVQIGHNFGIVRLSSNLEAEHEWDRTRQRGIELHIARRINANGDGFNDGHAKTQMKEVNRFLFEQAGRGHDEQALWAAMGERFFENDDFSVAWNGQTGMLKRNRQTANARAGVKIGTGKISARANVNAALTHDHVYEATMASIDSSGQTQTASHRVGAGHRVGLQAAVNFTVSDAVTRASHDANSEPTDVASVAMFAPNLLSFEVPLIDGFRQAKVTLVREKGQTQVHASNADMEFANVDDYARTLRGQPSWALAFGMASTTPMALPTTPEERRAAIRLGQTKIEAHLAELKANPLSNLRHVFRIRIRKETAAELDAIDERIASVSTEREAAAQRGHGEAGVTQGQDATIARLTAKRDLLLRGRNAWIPTELLTVQSLDRDFAAGVRMGLQVEMRDGARGEHELASLKLKPNEAEALDALWPTAL